MCAARRNGEASQILCFELNGQGRAGAVKDHAPARFYYPAMTRVTYHMTVYMTAGTYHMTLYPYILSVKNGRGAFESTEKIRCPRKCGDAESLHYGYGARASLLYEAGGSKMQISSNGGPVQMMFEASQPPHCTVSKAVLNSMGSLP